MSGFLGDWFGCCAFAAANPEFFTALLSPSNSGIQDSLRNLLVKSPRLWGDPTRVDEYTRRLAATAPPIELPRHIFPVYVPQHQIGMLAPLNVTTAPVWAASDAFGTFAVPEARNSLDGLMRLLQRLESALERRMGAPVPLRWRTAFAFSLGCPIHAAAIEGKSLQIPLLLCVLREFCMTQFSDTIPASMPFGSGPVFATGELAANGSFGEVGNVPQKLDAYLREFPSRPIAVLTGVQIDAVRAEKSLRDRIASLCVFRADNLEELLELEPFRERLPALAEPPHPIELDRMFDEIGRLSRSIRFNEARKLADWLLPSNPPAPYRLRLVVNAGMCLLHDGNYLEALGYLHQAEVLMRDSVGLFGADDRANLVSSVASALLDSAEPEEGLRILEWAKPLDACTIPARVRVQGTASQLLRCLEHWDEAVLCGQEAVRLARLGFAGDAGRDMNYLIHALLRRAAVSPSQPCEDIRLATELLEESVDTWAPREHVSLRGSHLGFCHHYRAEIARILRVPHEPALDPPWIGAWDFPRIFVLLACARNHAHSRSCRIEFARRAEAEAVRLTRTPDQIFSLFHRLVCLYTAWLMGEDLKLSANQIRDWCRRQVIRGAPGWERRFNAVLDLTETHGTNEFHIERLLSVLPYL